MKKTTLPLLLAVLLCVAAVIFSPEKHRPIIFGAEAFGFIFSWYLIDYQKKSAILQNAWIGVIFAFFGLLSAFFGAYYVTISLCIICIIYQTRDVDTENRFLRNAILCTIPVILSILVSTIYFIDYKERLEEKIEKMVPTEMVVDKITKSGRITTIYPQNNAGFPVMFQTVKKVDARHINNQDTLLVKVINGKIYWAQKK